MKIFAILRQFLINKFYFMKNKIHKPSLNLKKQTLKDLNQIQGQGNEGITPKIPGVLAGAIKYIAVIVWKFATDICPPGQKPQK